MLKRTDYKSHHGEIRYIQKDGKMYDVGFKKKIKKIAHICSQATFAEY